MFFLDDNCIINGVELLAKIKSSLSDSELEEIIQKTKELKIAQEKEDSPEAKASLPRLTLSDIEREAKMLPINVKKADGEDNKSVTILEHEVQTNGILYVDVASPFGEVAMEDLVLLPLLTRMLTETGTSQLSEVYFCSAPESLAK